MITIETQRDLLMAFYESPDALLRDLTKHKLTQNRPKLLAEINRLDKIIANKEPNLLIMSKINKPYERNNIGVSQKTESAG